MNHISFAMITIDNVIQAQRNTGANVDRYEYDTARYSGGFKVLSANEHGCMVAVGFQNDDDGGYYVSIGQLVLNDKGVLVVIWNGEPEFEHEDEDEVVDYICRM